MTTRFDDRKDARKVIRGVIARWLSLSVLTGLAGLSPHPVLAAIRLPSHPEECVSWAAGDLNSALNDTGVSPATADVAVAVKAVPGARPESFMLAVTGRRVSITGSDSVGAMYGLFELAEQIRQGGAGGSWPAVLATVAPTTQQPYVSFRGDNAFIPATNRTLGLDVGMWDAYIDMLARSRYNVLDLHGGYDTQTTGFPNFYPLLVHVPEYPEIGFQSTQDKNLADFKQIVDHAHARGVAVAFMNYSAHVDGIPASQLADYTAKAVAALLKAVPNLHTLGFRIGESGQPASFFQDAYLRGLKDSGRTDVQLYTRSWGATQDQLEQIAAANGGKLDIEIKYNGEHLGLPYQALHGGYKDYSYQGYIRNHAPYRIIWQVRANGTHRFWPWADTAFIRRTVRTLPFGDARGMTLEPPIAYFSPYARDYYQSHADQTLYDYTWQRWWMWYLAWGRLAYNPDLPEITLVKAYSATFGPAGPAIYQAMQAAGPIVPLALSYRFPGPDQRDFSPETETGAFNYHKSSEKQADVLSFGRNRPMDDRSFVGIDTAVSERIAGVTDGRMGPDRVADLFASAAEATRRLVESVHVDTRPEADEWRLLKADLLAASYLGDYYADRIRGVLHLDYALRTGSKPDEEIAVADLQQSRADWKKLSDTMSLEAPLSNNLRHQPHFQWADELAPLEKLDATVPALWATVRVDAAAVPWDAASTHNPAPEASAPAGFALSDVSHSLGPAGTVVISCRAAAPGGVDHVLLWSMPLPSESKWKSYPMTAAANGIYSMTLPLTDAGLLYTFEVFSRNKQAAMLPSALEETPYFVISPAEAAGGPPAPH